MQKMKDLISQAYGDTEHISAFTRDSRRQKYYFIEDREECQSKLMIANAFIEKFILKDSDRDLLKSPSINISTNFFSALDRLHIVYKNCSILFGSQESNVGLQIMESLNSLEESAYERLFKWTLYECRRMKEESPEIPIELRQALHKFRLRPILFE